MQPLRSAVIRLRRLRVRAAEALLSGSSAPAAINRHEQFFIDWVAERAAIPRSESAARYERGRSVFRHGYGGPEYRWFCVTAYDALRPIFDDRPEEIVASYRQHAPMHLLRMLSYETPDWAGHPVVSAMAGKPSCRIADYGCGLAQGSIALAERLIAGGVDVHLTVADLPSLRHEFLAWVLNHTQVPHTVLDSGLEPTDVGPWDVLIATEFFEHVHDPLAFYESLVAGAQPGAFMVADIGDHRNEYMHVSPQLDPLRKAVARDFREVQPDVYQRHST